MFGYVNINRKELSEENKKEYQNYYCGLCQQLRCSCGSKGQILLNYDMTFLVVLLTGLYELENQEKIFTCPLHPTKKSTAWMNEATEYAADMNVLLAYYNLQDDWKDNKEFSKKAFVKMLDKDYNRICQKYPRQAEALKNSLDKLNQAEDAKETNIDLLSGLSGEMISEIFAWKPEDIWAEELKNLGFYLGKFIYLMDAYEDLDADKKKGEFNALIHMKCESKQEFDTVCKLMLTSMISECARSFERLPVILHADVLRNVLYSGVWTKYEYLQLKKKKQQEKKQKSKNRNFGKQQRNNNKKADRNIVNPKKQSRMKDIKK